jgi:hypothetical protein
MELLKIIKKGWRMNVMENFYILKYQQEDILIQEQNIGGKKPSLSSSFIHSTKRMRQNKALTYLTQPQQDSQ